MRRVVLLTLLVITLTLFVLAAAQPGAALPEYAEQTGETCATCHASPSGGGMRTPRGQAWVGEGRGGMVPGLTEALALLGVKLTVDEADFVAPPAAAGGGVPLSEPLSAGTTEAQQLDEWLRNLEGN
jgi:hypothetical protein